MNFERFCWKNVTTFAFTQPHTHMTQQSIYLSKPMENRKCSNRTHRYYVEVVVVERRVKYIILFCWNKSNRRMYLHMYVFRYIIMYFTCVASLITAIIHRKILQKENQERNPFPVFFSPYILYSLACSLFLVVVLNQIRSLGIVLLWVRRNDTIDMYAR